MRTMRTTKKPAVNTTIRRRANQFLWICRNEKISFWGLADTLEEAKKESSDAASRFPKAEGNASYALKTFASQPSAPDPLEPAISRSHVRDDMPSPNISGETDENQPRGICPPAPAPAPTVSSYFHTFLDSKKDLKKSSLLKYTQIYDSFINPLIGEKAVDQISSDILESLLTDLVYSDVSPITAGVVRSLLSSLFKSAKKAGLITRDPMAEIEIPRNRKRPQGKTTFKESELDELLLRFQRSSFLPVLQLGIWTGMRIGEILGLQTEDINFKEKLLHVRHTLTFVRGKFILESPKSDSGIRTVPVSEKCLNMMKKHLSDEETKQRRILAPDDYKNLVFLSMKGTPIFESAVGHQLRAVTARMKSEGCLDKHGTYTFHSLRHTFATTCLLNGMKPKVLATILGHSSTKITLELYTHISQDDARREMQKAGML